MLGEPRIPPGPPHLLPRAGRRLETPILPQSALGGPSPGGFLRGLSPGGFLGGLSPGGFLPSKPWRQIPGALHLLLSHQHLETAWRALGTAFLGDFRGEAKSLWVPSQFLLAVGKLPVFSSSLIPPPWKPPSSFTEEQCHCDGTRMGQQRSPIPLSTAR